MKSNKVRNIGLAILAMTIGLVGFAHSTAIGNYTVGAITSATFEKAEDSAHTSTDKGVMGLGVRKAAAFTDLSAGATDGDYEPYQINVEGAVRTSPTASATGGWNTYSNIDVDETTGTTTQQIKASAGVLHTCAITNDTAATVEYLKIYNAVSLTGSAAGTETPAITIPLVGGHVTTNVVLDAYFDTGITVAATTGIAVADTGAPAGNAVVVNCTYK